MTDRTRDDHDAGDQDLLARLRSADPTAGADARPPDVADSWIDELTEATMGRTLEQERPEAEPAAQRRTWAWAGAAAALVLGATAVGIMTGGPETPYVGAGPTQTVMTLALPPAVVAGSCIQFSVDILRPMEVAFSGTASRVDDGSVTLKVDHWYKGGSSNEVKLTTIDRSVALDGLIAFEEGKRYLITATNGEVNACGFSSEWTPEMAEAFAEAFGG
jgi:hypothetical protein